MPALSTAFSEYSCWLVCLPSILHSVGTAAGSCVWPQYCILWVQLLPRVSGLSTAFSGYSCWLVCLASVLHSLGTAAGSWVCPQYCILWVQPMAHVPAHCAAFSEHLCSLVLCPENPKATQTVKRGSCVSMGSLFCIVAVWAKLFLTEAERLE